MSDFIKLIVRHGGEDHDDDGASNDMPSMGENMSGGVTANEMSNEFHASAKDTLWISPWVPASAGAVFGACVLLFFLAALTCFLAALQRSLTVKWANEARRRQTFASNVPFVFSNDVQRGLLHMLHLGLLYLLMLAVMTYNAYYFVSILIGYAAGEATFGRFGRSSTFTRDLHQDDSADLTPLQSQAHERHYTPHVNRAKELDE